MDGVAKTKAIRIRHPLELLTTLNGMALCLLAGGYGWAVVTTLFGDGSIFGYGHEAVICTGTGDMGSGSGSTSEDWLIRPRAGVTVFPTHADLCTSHPTSGQRWWATVENLPGTVTLLTAVLVAYLALQKARSQGPYSLAFAARLRFLGWFLLADSVIRPVIEVFAAHKLWASLADGPLDHRWRPVWATLLAGIALLSLARIMGVGSAMREDLEGVV